MSSWKKMIRFYFETSTKNTQKKHAEFINKARGEVLENSIRKWLRGIKNFLGSDKAAWNYPEIC